MRKFICATLFCSVLLSPVLAQVGIGTNSPNPSSILELNSTSKVFLPPRMTTAQRNQIANPVAGMTIFNTTSDCIEIYRSTGWYSLCGGGGTTPGDSSSNDVASSNLIAHWTFDTDSKESKSGTAALTGGAYNVGTVSYTPGKIGNAATFVNGALVYGAIPNINKDTALQSYTVSMWVKMRSREGANTKWNSLFQLNSNAYTDIFGIIGIQALNQKSKDTLALQVDQTQVDGNDPYVHTGGFGCGGCFNNVNINLTNPLNFKADTTQWTLLTVTYDGNGLNQKLKIYGNGVVLDSLTLATVKKSPNIETFRVVPTGGTGTGAPAAWANYVTIGTFNWAEFPIFSGTNGYSQGFPTYASRSSYMGNGINGSIDDIRLFNKALTSAEIQTLYTRGNAGK
ncbi:MAG: hypothetical protein QM791_22315 [Ferruginibacter sp.]